MERGKQIWKDYRLVWNPLKYSNISSIRFAGAENQIWRPDILLYNSANEDFDSTFKSNEVVYNTGEINWVPPGIFRASCKMDITYFPFDDQSCFLQFGSWTYHAGAVDLRISESEDSAAVDLSTYTPSAEWLLKSCPAVRKATYWRDSTQPYYTITFFLNLRRKTLFYLFNVVMPSLLIALMTLMGFCLPAHDMSEKIGFQTTILLSICFFVTIVSEMTPPTSESVPLLGVCVLPALPSGIFFSTLTLIISVSTAFTITVLNIRYRQPENHNMSPTFYKIFIIWLPWLLLMKRPGYTYQGKKQIKNESDEEEQETKPDMPELRDSSCDSSCDSIPLMDLEGDISSQRYESACSSTEISIVTETGRVEESTKRWMSCDLNPCKQSNCTCAFCIKAPYERVGTFPQRKPRNREFEQAVDAPKLQNGSVSLLQKLNSIPSERLFLSRKVGEGIFRSQNSLPKRSHTTLDRLEKYVRLSMAREKTEKETVFEEYMKATLAYYTHIYQNIRIIKESGEDEEENNKMEEWKFAAMALDRLCLIIFTTFIGICVSAVVFVTPYIDA